MEKKRILALVLSIVVIAIAVVVFIIVKNNSGDTGSFKETKFEVGNYQIELKSKEAGHPENGYNFVARYSKKYEYDNYDLSFGVRVSVSAKNESVYDKYSDYDGLNEVGIFNKRFKYKTESKKVKLLYKYDENLYLEIELKDSSDYLNKDESLLKTTSNVEEYNFFEKATQDSEFRSFLSLNISKK